MSDEPLDRGLCYRAGLCAAYSGSTESINLLYSHELLSDADMSTSICKEADGNVTLAAVAVFANRVPVLRNLADKVYLLSFLLIRALFRQGCF